MVRPMVSVTIDEVHFTAAVLTAAKMYGRIERMEIKRSVAARRGDANTEGFL